MNQTDTDAWTIKRLLEWTADYFNKQGRDAPRLAAEVLLAEALECRRIDLYARFDQVPAEPHLSRYREWVRRHAQGEPVAYLVGHRDFFSLRFQVTPDVLIPRPETEELVLLALDEIKSWPSRRWPVLDIGTGSGCLAITLAHQVPELQVIAVDISPAALAVARVNAEAHDVASRIQFVESDLFAGLADDSRFPMIVSNPPYVGADDPELDPLVRRYEPHQALIGGQDGGELSKRLIEESASYLSPGGLLLIETSPMLAESLLAHAQSTGQYASCQIRKDLAKLPRILVCRAPA